MFIFVAVMEMCHFDLPSKIKSAFLSERNVSIVRKQPPAVPFGLAFELRPCSFSGRPQTMIEHSGDNRA